MRLKNLLTEEQVGFVVGYTTAFVIDYFAKFTAAKYGYKTVRCGYKTISWVASKTRISPPTGQVLSERVVYGVWNAY